MIRDCGHILKNDIRVFSDAENALFVAVIVRRDDIFGLTDGEEVAGELGRLLPLQHREGVGRHLLAEERVVETRRVMDFAIVDMHGREEEFRRGSARKSKAIG